MQPLKIYRMPTLARVGVRDMKTLPLLVKRSNEPQVLSSGAEGINEVHTT